MRKLLFLILIAFSSLSGIFLAFQSTAHASVCLFNWSQSGCDSGTPPYCSNGECTLTGGLNATKVALHGSGINTVDSGSAFVVKIVRILLTFVSLIAVIYVLWAGFQIMTGGGDEEKMKKARKTIIYVVIGIIIMWLAYAIVNTVITALAYNGNTSVNKYIASIEQRITGLIPETQAATYNDSARDTFIEYKDRLTIAIQDLESEFKVNNSVDPGHLTSLKSLVQEAYNRLPDFGDAGTQNDMMKRAVERDIDVAIKNPKSSADVGTAISTVSNFLGSAQIKTIEGSINVSTSEGNAPLTVSFEAGGVKDPSGTTPDQSSYIWWMRENGGVRRELGRGKNLVQTFSQEGSYTVFLDVVSRSRNTKGKIDVLPLTTSTTVEVKPRMGEVILLVNGVNVSNLNSLKINPNIGKMGIIFDATASRATAGTITETEWDFGNSNTLTYKGSPIIERQIYANDGNYPVSLKFKTNNGQSFTKEIQLIVRNPSAVIETEKTVGNVGDEMYFSSTSYFTNTQNVQYAWSIQDDNNKKIANNIAGSTFKYKFEKIGKYIVTLTARSPNGDIDTDSKEITIESREPVINLEAPKELSPEQPNIFVFDATKSYDPDTMTKNGLTYTWRIDGQKVDLDNSTENGAKGTYTFKSTGNHTVSVTVANGYGKVASTDQSFNVSSVLSANMLITPRVAPLGTIVNFIGQSENASFFDWNMGDGSPVTSGSKKIVQHVYQKTGTYDVVMTVSDSKSGGSNSVTRRIYVTDAGAPYAMVDISNGSNTAYYDKTACGSGATVVNRSEITTFDGQKSINVDGNTSDLTYTWDYFGKINTNPSFSEKLGDIGCYPVKLTVRSNKTGTTHSSLSYVAIRNQPPEITSISTSIDTTKKDSQKVLVRVSANGAVDPDGVITSYIWYYTTESDKEPQNIQITQKPEITFVLPNITEKYYFGVILEDNDGSRTNSMREGTNQVPLILDNQNGNIYMPLISLTTPKNSVLVGEPVQVSVEAKTIVGTNITKNAEYAWDFDGDGRYDERSTTPSISHAYKNSGTYSMKVKVTYNGVSNTKYATIYVKNPLKASAQGYTLPDGSIYFLNTSIGSYDTAHWNLTSGTQIESPYSVTLSPTQVATLAGNDVLGTLRVTSNNTDTSSVALTRSGLTTLTNASGTINYQSSPIATNDTIHISGPGEKILISLLGNNANRYQIDTDTRIDSNLDGVPDNDIDNKDSASYHDGTVYAIADTTDVRVRERTIRLSVYRENELLGTKDVKVIFDFIQEVSANSGDDVLQSASGSMSQFDREKLDALATLIRGAESSDRIVLMNLYNTMIENWDDSFSKAKSLIDIQEATEATSLSSEKKSTISSLIDELLTGSATATDDVTLASKLIEGLIPANNANRATILEKLTAINSHPDKYEENKKLATEILALIKDDPSIEDKYKLHIKNQLRVIISGGQANVTQTETDTSSGSTGSSILKFISGVVWVFLYILGGILLVLLLGYIFYLVSRKDKEIGFQDFLIDSVFHVKKTPKKEVIATPDATNIVVNTPHVEEKKLTVDPLANYTPPPPVISVTPSVTVDAPPVDPLAEATIDTIGSSGGNIPSWLQIPKTESTTTTTTTTTTTASAPLPETEKTETLVQGNTEVVTESTTAPGKVPDWLKIDTSSKEDVPEEIKTEDFSIIEETPAPTVAAPGDIPDWLKGETSTTITTTTQTQETIENKDSPLPPSEELPDWLIDSVKTEPTPVVESIITETTTTVTEDTPAPKTEKVVTKKKKESKTTEPKKPQTAKKKAEATTVKKTTTTTTTTKTTDSNIPDWLK